MKRITKFSDEESTEEETIYSDDFREEMLDAEGISAWEAAFMEGYDEAG